MERLPVKLIRKKEDNMELFSSVTLLTAFSIGFMLIMMVVIYFMVRKYLWSF